MPKPNPKTVKIAKMLAETPIAHLEALPLFIAAAKKFVEKCETGRARSRVTYSELKAALETAKEYQSVAWSDKYLCPANYSPEDCHEKSSKEHCGKYVQLKDCGDDCLLIDSPYVKARRK